MLHCSCLLSYLKKKYAFGKKMLRNIFVLKLFEPQVGDVSWSLEYFEYIGWNWKSVVVVHKQYHKRTASILLGRISNISSALGEFPLLYMLFGARHGKGTSSFVRVSYTWYGFIWESRGFQIRLIVWKGILWKNKSESTENRNLYLKQPA